MNANPLITLLLVATAAVPVSARESETIHQVYDTGKNPRLSVQNINGDLTVEGWDKRTIEVTAIKTASSKERLDDLQIRFRMDNDHLRVDVKYEDDDNWNQGRFAVDITVHVPRGTRIDAVELVNGDVQIMNIEGDVDASSVNGEVTGEKLGGHVDLATVNGEVSLLATGGIESIRLHSVNGDVLLVLPEKFDARIEAGTVHGTIRAMNGFTDVEATDFTGSSMHGTLGKGGMKVDLNTVNGSIEIRREGESGSKDRE